MCYIGMKRRWRNEGKEEVFAPMIRDIVDSRWISHSEMSWKVS